MSTIDVKKNAKNFTFAIIDIASDSCEFNYSELDEDIERIGAEYIIKDFVLGTKLAKYMPDFGRRLNNIYLVPLINEDYQIRIANILDAGVIVMTIDLRSGVININEKGYAGLMSYVAMHMNELIKNFMNEMGLVYDKEQ